MSGSEIRQLRHRMGLTLREFAEVMGVSKNTVQNWEKDRTTPGNIHHRMLVQLEERVQRQENAKELGQFLLSLAAGVGIGAVLGTIFENLANDENEV